ncbi:hypothetical protein BJ742DRAFT_331205 [Cladochytrium replicatum]|nr:hypothetical protein BJ742DRAFT_331205 [Cladochytrium replicatum]
MEYNVEMPSIAIFTAADAIKCGEEGDIDLARAIFEIISVDVSKKGDQKVSTTILFSGVTRRWHAYPEAACPRFWITWANWEEDKGNPMGALTVCETAMGKFTDKEDIELIYATVKRIFESIDNDAGDPIVDDNFREEEQLMGQQKEQDNSITETAVENPIQTPRNTTFQKTWRPSLNSQNGDPFDDTPEPVFGRLFGKPVRGTPHPGHGGNDSLAKIMNDVSLEDDDSDALDPAETQTESDDEHHSHKKASLDQNDNDCDVFLASAQKTSRDRRKSPVNRRKSEMSKKVRVGVRVDEDSEETTGSRVTVLTPRKARKNERESLGVSEIITPVRRSRRLFDESMYVPTQAEALEIMENLEKPYKFECDASVRNRDDKENEQSLFGHQGEKVSKLLENYGYAYAPNKVFMQDIKYALNTFVL